MNNTSITPFFSVIMPAYNASEYLAAAIQSVKDQVFQNWELIVVNDGSTDNTESIAQEYASNDSRIILISQPNKGLAGARNTGLENSKGPWIAFLDSDDLWLPEKLQLQYHHINQDPQLDILYTNGYSLFDNTPAPIYYHFQVLAGKASGADTYEKIILNNYIPVLSVVVKKDWLTKIGSQDTTVTSGSEDWDFWIRLAKAGATFMGLSERLFIYRVHAGGMSSQRFKQQRSSYDIIVKNIEPNVLPQPIINRVIKNQIPFINELARNNKQEGNKEATKLAALYKGNALLEGLKSLLPPLVFLNLLVTKLNPISRIKGKLSSIIYRSATTILYSLKEFKEGKADLYNSHYHRWKYKSQLNRSGYFYMHKTAKINVTAPKAKLVTFGLGIYEYSQINLSRDVSYLFTGSDVVIGRYCNFNIWQGRVILGNNVSFNNYCSLNCIDEITIGNNTWFGEGVRFYDHNHKFKEANKPFTEQGFSIGKIRIGNNCWIGSNTVILQNVTIGDNCVIGANNLIHKSLPPNTIVKAKAMEIVEEIKR